MSVRKAPSAKFSALSAACASTISHMIMVPCETIKVQLQLFQKVAGKGESVLMNSINVIYRKEGIRGFWRGYFVSISCSIPFCSCYYPIFETLRKKGYEYAETHSKITPFVPAITSSMAQFLTCFVTAPLDRMRTQYWANRNQTYNQLIRGVVREARVNGFLSLYHGFRPMVIRDICFSTIYWSTYEHLRNFTASFGVSPILQNLISASIGGVLTSSAVTPFDLVKTRQQVLYTTEGVFKSMKMIIQEEGIRGIFRGLTPRVVQNIPSMSIMMIVYDSLNRLILRKQAGHA